MLGQIVENEISQHQMVHKVCPPVCLKGITKCYILYILKTMILPSSQPPHTHISKSASTPVSLNQESGSSIHSIAWVTNLRNSSTNSSFSTTTSNGEPDLAHSVLSPPQLSLPCVHFSPSPLYCLLAIIISSLNCCNNLPTDPPASTLASFQFHPHTAA